jgi:hypothetical protein
MGRSGSQAAYLSERDLGSTGTIISMGTWIITTIIARAITAHSPRAGNIKRIIGCSFMAGPCTIRMGTKLPGDTNDPQVRTHQNEQAPEGCCGLKLPPQMKRGNNFPRFSLSRLPPTSPSNASDPSNSNALGVRPLSGDRLTTYPMSLSTQRKQRSSVPLGQHFAPPASSLSE